MELNTTDRKLSSDKLCMNTLGIHSSRYNSLVILDEHTIIYSLGGKVQKYSSSSKSVIASAFVSHSIIMSITKYKNLLIILSYNGVISILDLDFKLISSFPKIPGVDMIKHLAINENFSMLALNSEFYFNEETGKDTEGALIVYKVTEKNGYQITPLKIIAM